MTRKALIAAAEASDAHTVRPELGGMTIETKALYGGWADPTVKAPRHVTVVTGARGFIAPRSMTVKRAAEWLGLGGAA